MVEQAPRLRRCRDRRGQGSGRGARCRARRPRPRGPGRPRGVDRAAADDVRGRAPADDVTDVVAGRTRQPAQRTRRAGRAVRARGEGAAGLVGRDERRARPGRRRDVARAGQPGAARVRRAAAPDDPRRLRAAGRRRGVRRRRRRRDRDVRLRLRARAAAASRSTSSPGRPTSTAWPPSGCCGASSASTPRRARPRSPSWPTTAPTRSLRRGRPDQPGRARHRRRPACWSPTRRRSPRRVERELARQVAADQARRARRPRRCPAAQSAIVLVDDLDQGDRRRRRLRRRAPRDAHQRRRLPGRAQVRNAGAVFVGPYAPVSLGDYCAGSNHVLPTAAARATRRGCRCARSSRPCRSSTTPRRRCGSRAGARDGAGEAEDLPRTRTPSGSGWSRHDATRAELAPAAAAAGAASERAVRRSRS